MSSSLSQVSIPEGIVRLTHALVEDASLRSWFFGLEQHSAAIRHAALTQMAEQMHTEDPELASAISALTHPALFDAVRNALRDRCAE